MACAPATASTGRFTTVTLAPAPAGPSQLLIIKPIAVRPTHPHGVAASMSPRQRRATLLASPTQATSRPSNVLNSAWGVKQVGQDLNGVSVVGQQVHHRRLRPFGQIGQRLVCERAGAARRSGATTPGPHLGSLALTQADLIGPNRHRMPSELHHRHFGGVAGAGRRLLKDKSCTPSLQEAPPTDWGRPNERAHRPGRPPSVGQRQEVSHCAIDGRCIGHVWIQSIESGKAGIWKVGGKVPASISRPQPDWPQA